MNNLWVRHVREAIRTGFSGFIDLSDYAASSDSLREKAFLSRGLAALAVQRYTGLAPSEAAKSVVDGSGDNGLDAVVIDDAHRQVILVQSKWDGTGNRGLGLGDARNFVAGFKDLLDLKFTRFTPALQAQEEVITAALDDPDISFLLVVATTGRAELAHPVREVFEDVLKEMNENRQTVSVEILGLNEFHALIAGGVDGSRVSLKATLENWGVTGEPYEAYYGVVSAESIADWYERNGDRLFSQNIRKSLGRTSVNDSLIDTLLHEPENFWYFNNGVTALCESVKKTARGATSRTFAEFQLSGVSVVNGAQTVASIHSAARKDPDSVGRAKVWVRFISLEGCPSDFDAAVTRATNTQNTVESRDFVALDPEQSRLRTELVLSLKKTYSIKRGEPTPELANGCTVVDATISLACANRDPNLAVVAKSRLGSLWESTEKAPYRLLFNPGVGPYRLWRCVEVMRAVDSRLQERRRALGERPKAIALQGNRLVLHLVFRALDISRIDDADFQWDEELAKVPEVADSVLDALIKCVDKNYPTSYVTSLFKNAAKCRLMVDEIRGA
ncbi:AIPR family protein [Melissospora conviva]|uniref:AIPR family protein n=1 Tax=Melissospora conviva TaxID=3388432 RepID=UPI003C29B9B0